ncbi:serine hydrolase [Embleya sp. AB8]|uniref:serine hydrolase n=1 Tax=Embleya sp. AB8 TaxID=3156304 RepID=UPI003C71D6DB
MSPAHPKRARPALVPLAIVLVCATLLWLVVSRSRAEPASYTATPTAPATGTEPTEPALPPSTTPGTARAAAPQPPPTTAVPAVSAASALAAALPALTGNLSVAILDPATGERAGYNDEHPYVTASIVKVDILATLLLQAQQDHRALTADERATAATMIQNSDNDAADTLWSAIGGPAGLRTANTTLGLTETEPIGASWGLTETTAADQLRLLDAITATDSPLTAASRAYLAGLMTSIEDDQIWGVSTAADPDTTPALKNGWLPRDATGLWVINSIGHITHAGRPLLIAVLSDDQQSMDEGVTQLESVAKAAAPAVLTNVR